MSVIVFSRLHETALRSENYISMYPMWLQIFKKAADIIFPIKKNNLLVQSQSSLQIMQMAYIQI